MKAYEAIYSDAETSYTRVFLGNYGEVVRMYNRIVRSNRASKSVFFYMEDDGEIHYDKGSVAVNGDRKFALWVHRFPRRTHVYYTLGEEVLENLVDLRLIDEW